MAFKPISAKVRKDPLGHGLANDLVENNDNNAQLLYSEHTPDGKHNSIEVPRAVGLIRYSGGSYTLHSSSSSTISSISSPSTGKVTLTLESGKFSTPMSIRLTPMDSTTDTVPWLCSYEVTSATSVSVYVRKLSATDTWTLTNGSFAIGIHSAPFTSSASVITQPSKLVRGSNLGKSHWNTMVSNQATVRTNQLVGHASGGAHTAKEFPIGYFAAWEDVSEFNVLTRVGYIDSISMPATGVFRANLTASTFTAPFPVFAWSQARPEYYGGEGTPTIACVPEDELTSTVCNVYVYYQNRPISYAWAKDIGVNVYCQIHRGT
jgi:hypothetical protein